MLVFALYFNQFVMKKPLFILSSISVLALAGCSQAIENNAELENSDTDNIEVQENDLSQNNNEMQENNNENIVSDQAVAWDRVLVNYIWTFDDGEVFDTNLEDVAKESWLFMEQRPYEPLEFVIWQQQVIAWFENWVLWLKEWEKVVVNLTPDQAYWEYDETAIQQVPLQTFIEAWIEPVEWQVLNFWMAQWKILSSDEQNVTVDFNHPMAWKNLNFEITLVEIVR